MPSSASSELERLRLENERLLLEVEHLAEARLASAEACEEMIDLFDYAPLAYVVLDGVGTILRLNRAATKLLGERVGRQGLEGKRLKTLVIDADHSRLGEHMQSCSIKPDGVVSELRLSDGTPIQVWSRRMRPGVRMYATVIVNLSERDKTAEENTRLQAAEKAARAASEAKDDFIAALSHELRTPLTPVLAAVTALEGRDGIPDDLRKTFDMIRRNVVTEARLIDDLLDVTRIVRRKMRIEAQPLDVHATARDVVETLAPEIAAKRLSVGLFLEAQHHNVSGDSVRLKQVFWNLMRNAVKFTPAGGQIELRSWNRAASGTRWVHIEVSDTGLGFDPAMAEKLFEPFEQGPEMPERNGGLGLGLAICRGIMELHRGRIAASSQGPGRGSRFVIEIEVIDQVVAPIPERRKTTELDVVPSGMRILLVEDDADTADILSELLDRAGYCTLTVPSVQAALTSDLDAIDLVISDIGLPGASGLELMRTIRARGHLKGVALSGYGTEADIRASADAGFSAHLTKPISIDDLLSAIRHIND
ncbi:MAG: ATP-binding protein [Pseudomonadota bacterium]